MRTVILISTFCICDAINKDWNLDYPDNVNNFISAALLIVIFMDTVDFTNTNFKK